MSVKLQFETEKDVVEALAVIKAVGDFLTLMNGPDTPDFLEGTLGSFGYLLIGKSEKIGQNLGLT